MEFDKKPLAVEQQIQLLQERGMTIPELKKASLFLTNISYYRLSAYWYTFLQNPKSEHVFIPGTTFDKVLNTYVFDRKLRLLIFDEIERIEISLRTKLIYEYCLEFGNNWYENKSLFKGKDTYYYKLQELLISEMNKTSEVFIRHYRRKYSSPPNPPAWMALELASFGQLSMLFKNLKPNSVRKRVAAHFGVDEIVLESWLESLSYVRNACAHHMRLWNRKLPKTPIVPKNPQYIWLEKNPNSKDENKIYLTLCIIGYLLARVSPGNSFSKKISNLLSDFPEIPNHYMGFTPNWKKEYLWGR
ncbi:Abi family protein [Arthrospiribacter ruber]|uniref:Abi family protein n=1 Tax=Arthrospiribacter ruber TaxID=2487934 RepID=A0A951MF63_9BACT|nr:Abi family protein [Arthrospiribacter ruber]MBW3470034.1 Abi family protein [Arthrospiribacter ruber]